MKKEQTNLPSSKDTKNPADKLPEELMRNYRLYARKSSFVIECLRVAAALKLWDARGFRDIKFDVPKTVGGKTFFVKILARDAEGGVVGVECASILRLEWLQMRVAQLRCCLPPDSWIIAVFHSNVDERVREVVKFVDEVWITGKNGMVEQMMFVSVFRKG